jgi:hypothetical protein
MTDEKKDACPKCGSDNGIEFSRWEKFTGVMPWDGSGETMTFEGSTKGGRVGKCLDCGERVKVPYTYTL